jgi:hypothetical protein
MPVTDPDLEHLVADMSAAQTPAPRHSGGGVRNQGNDQGTLDDSTVQGRQRTVLSDKEDGSGIPLEVNMHGHNNSERGLGYNANTAIQALNGKRFKIFVVPKSLDETFGTFCFQLIGQVASFCTARNWDMAHHHASAKKVKPGEIYLAKSSTTAFVTPSITTKVIGENALTTWKSLTLSLPEWNEKFFIATAASDEIPASSAAIEMHKAFCRTKALNFKTPAKRKRGLLAESSPPLSVLDISIYSPFFKEDEVAPITDIKHVAGILARLDAGILSNNKAIITFIEDFRNEHVKSEDASRAMWLRLEALTSSVGIVPAKLAFDYLSPSSWASIGAMAEKLDEI